MKPHIFSRYHYTIMRDTHYSLFLPDTLDDLQKKIDTKRGVRPPSRFIDSATELDEVDAVKAHQKKEEATKLQDKLREKLQHLKVLLPFFKM